MKPPQTRNGKLSKMRKTFSEKFKFVRTKVLQLSQDEMGILIGMSHQGFVSDVEKNKKVWWRDYNGP